MWIVDLSIAYLRSNYEEIPCPRLSPHRAKKSVWLLYFCTVLFLTCNKTTQLTPM